MILCVYVCVRVDTIVNYGMIKVLNPGHNNSLSLSF